MLEPEDKGRVIQAALYLVLAAIGGILGYLTRAAESGTGITAGMLALKAAGAAFAGFLVFLVALYFSLDWIPTGILVGLAGWIGADATLQVLSTQVRKRLGLGREDQDDRR